jgi:hypothetical protein
MRLKREKKNECGRKENSADIKAIKTTIVIIIIIIIMRRRRRRRKELGN